MGNPARAKGTRFENEVLEALQTVWPAADRAKAGNPSNDFHGCPIPVEAKHRKRWDIPAWCRALKAVAGDGERWALVAAPGDRRTLEAPPTIMVVPFNFGVELLGHWERGRAIPPDH